MNNRWRWVPRISSVGILLLLLLSLWTLFFPSGEFMPLRFSLWFPAWLIAITFVVLFITIQEH